MIRLESIATASARRVGDHAIIDVTALSDEQYPRLVAALNVERLHHHLAELEAEQIRRFELPNLRTLHFVIHDAFASFPEHWLIGAQGRMLADHLLQLELPKPE